MTDDDDADVPVPAGQPTGAPDPDSLEGVTTPMSRLLGRSRWLIALILIVALVFPLGRWLLDEVAFQGSGDAVEEELGDAALLADAVLFVRAIDCGGVVSTGSAFAVEIGGEPTVVTNRHVVERARTIGVRPLDGGPSVRVDAHLLADGADVAVLRVDPADQPDALPTGPTPVRGDEVRIIGFPGGRAATTTGTLATTRADRLLLDLQVADGASGSPVLDDDGRVVGQVYARTEDGVGVATPLDRLVAAVGQARPAPAC